MLGGCHPRGDLSQGNFFPTIDSRVMANVSPTAMRRFLSALSSSQA